MQGGEFSTSEAWKQENIGEVRAGLYCHRKLVGKDGVGKMN